MCSIEGLLVTSASSLGIKRLVTLHILTINLIIDCNYILLYILTITYVKLIIGP